MKQTSTQLFSKLAMGLLTTALALPAYATAISYQVTNLDSNTWEYQYSVTNDTLGFNIEQFSIYFEHGFYDNLQVTSPLAAWDELAVNPALIFGTIDDGFYDALTLSAGIAPGNTVDGFSVSFNWLSTGTPGAQQFQIIDPDTFNVLASATTASVPLPGTMLLTGAGLVGMTVFRRRKKITNQHV